MSLLEQLAMTLPLPATSAESRRARDRGIRKTAAVNAAWLDEALAGMRRYCAGKTEVTVEAFRHWWLEQGGAAPSSPKAWGALGNRINNCGWLVFVGYQPAKSVKTHAHPVRVYRVIWSGEAE